MNKLKRFKNPKQSKMIFLDYIFDLNYLFVSLKKRLEKEKLQFKAQSEEARSQTEIQIKNRVNLFYY
jgi:hypothetical protein